MDYGNVYGLYLQLNIICRIVYILTLTNNSGDENRVIFNNTIRILNIVDIWSFEFWYNILMLGIMRANNSSMFLTVFLRRWAFYLIPDL